jgi:hypothetical protein
MRGLGSKTYKDLDKNWLADLKSARNPWRFHHYFTTLRNIS